MATSDHKELKAQWKKDIQVPTMEIQDVAKHNSKADLWIIIHGKVYDVTKYSRDHPGGAEALVEVAGQDATSAYEDVGHSEDAREIMHAYLVGTVDGVDLEGSSESSKPKLQVVNRSHKASDTHSGRNLHTELLISYGGGVLLLAAVWAAYSSFGLKHSFPGNSGFTTGFLSAAAVAAGVGYVAYHRLSQAMSFGGDYTKYPSHIHATNAVRHATLPMGVLKAQEYQDFELIRKDKLSTDSFHFVFKLPTSTSVLGLPIGQHVAMKGFYNDEEEQHVVTRSYTPVSNNRDLGRLELVIKVYPDGLLTGKYLSGLQIGEKVSFRGPKGAMRYRKGMSKHIGMVAGGTGITPMYQILRAICEDRTDSTTISLIYANKTQEDILLSKQLERFQKMAPKNLQVTLVLEKPPAKWTGESGRVNKAMFDKYLPSPSEDTKILLCGPPGMINASKSMLVDLGFEAPRAISKMTDQIFLF